MFLQLFSNQKNLTQINNACLHGEIFSTTPEGQKFMEGLEIIKSACSVVRGLPFLSSIIHLCNS